MPVANRITKTLAAAAIASTAFSVLSALTPLQADYNDGLDAYTQGEYDDAADIWERFGKAGDIRSRHVLGDVFSGKALETVEPVTLPENTEAFQLNDTVALAWYMMAAHHDFESYNQSPSIAEINAKFDAQERMPVLMRRMTTHQVSNARKILITYMSSGTEFDLYRLGVLYQSGTAVPKNNVEALKYYILAKGRNANSNSAASDAVRTLLTLMSKKEIELAHALAEKWDPPLPPALRDKTPIQRENEKLRKELRNLQLAKALNNVEPQFKDNFNLIQSALAALGMRPGVIDGQDGPTTRAAVRRFQYTLVEKKGSMTEAEKQATLTGTLTVHQKTQLIKRAAAFNHRRSQYVYGIMMGEGIGVAPNGKAALKWLQEAAKGGSALAHHALGTYYRDGILGEQPVRPHRGQSAYHFGQALALGHEPARAELQKLNFEFVPNAD